MNVPSTKNNEETIIVKENGTDEKFKQDEPVVWDGKTARFMFKNENGMAVLSMDKPRQMKRVRMEEVTSQKIKVSQSKHYSIVSREPKYTGISKF